MCWLYSEVKVSIKSNAEDTVSMWTMTFSIDCMSNWVCTVKKPIAEEHPSIYPWIHWSFITVHGSINPSIHGYIHPAMDPIHTSMDKFADPSMGWWMHCSGDWKPYFYSTCAILTLYSLIFLESMMATLNSGLSSSLVKLLSSSMTVSI